MRTVWYYHSVSAAVKSAICLLYMGFSLCLLRETPLSAGTNIHNWETVLDLVSTSVLFKNLVLPVFVVSVNLSVGGLEFYFCEVSST